jgi:dihydropteroate synthase
MELRLPQRTLRVPDASGKPWIMGIVNITDDSFSGDGTLDPDAALARASELVALGADFLDVGAESARTNRPPISEKEETERFLPFLAGWQAMIATTKPRSDSQVFPPVLSVNTWRSGVIKNILPANVELVNDMGGLAEPTNAELCAESNAALLIMHTVGLPKQDHSHVRYENLLDEVREFFLSRIHTATAAGLDRRSIILDPGLGFAKQPEDDFQILAGLQNFRDLDRPLLLPISRKGFLGAELDLPVPSDRDAATVGAFVNGWMNGAHLFRVHNVDAIWLARETLHHVFDHPPDPGPTRKGL